MTYKSKPVEGAMVKFELENKSQSAIGSTDAKGEYSLSTFNPSDGAVAGQYKVSISKFDPATLPTAPATPQGQIASGEIDEATYAPPADSGAAARAAAAGPKNELPAKYANPETSALRANVKDGQNKIDFDLK